MSALSAGECLALAQQSCTHCFGLGRHASWGGRTAVCNCVYRAIFRACHDRFRRCVDQAGAVRAVDIERPQHPGSRPVTYGMRRQEFAADFVLVAKRTLSEAQFRLFRFHFLLGADWRLCCRRLGMARGSFFHEVYRIQQLLGRTFADLEPHALWPCDEYFGSIRSEAHAVLVVDAPERERRQSVRRFPLSGLTAVAC